MTAARFPGRDSRHRHARHLPRHRRHRADRPPGRRPAIRSCGRPQPVAARLEPPLDPVHQRVALGPGQRRREELECLRVPRSTRRTAPGPLPATGAVRAHGAARAEWDSPVSGEAGPARNGEAGRGAVPTSLRRCWGDREMTKLRGRDQRALGRIEGPLAAADPGLAAKFAIFETMTRHDPMPATERRTPRLRRWLHRAGDCGYSFLHAIGRNMDLRLSLGLPERPRNVNGNYWLGRFSSSTAVRKVGNAAAMASPDSRSAAKLSLPPSQ